MPSATLDPPAAVPAAVASLASHPESALAPLRLGDLRAGQAGLVRAVRLARPLARRLFEMGLLPGTRVEVVRVAPLGDPLELCLRNYSLSIRRQEAMQVEVDLLAR